MNITYWKGWRGSLWSTYLKAMLVDNEWKRALFRCNVSGFNKWPREERGAVYHGFFFPGAWYLFLNSLLGDPFFQRAQRFFCYIRRRTTNSESSERVTRPNFTPRGLSIELSIISWIHDKRVESCAHLFWWFLPWDFHLRLLWK